MSRLSDKPPLHLESFKASYLRLKMDYIQALLRWNPDEYSTKRREDPSLDLRGEASYVQTRRRPRGLARV